MRHLILFLACLSITLQCGPKPKPGAASGTLWGIEPKLPMTAEENLKLRDETDRVVVEGQTFQYTFSKSNGLLTRIKVLNQDMTGDLSTAYPDIYISAAHDPVNELYYPREKDRGVNNPVHRPTYYARLEEKAKVSIDYQGPERVVIRSIGFYRSVGGETLGMQYEIAYEVYIDGVTYVRVTNRATRDLTFRYLTLSGGKVEGKFGKYYARLGDLAFSQSTGGFTFDTIPDTLGTFIEATYLPWFWVGTEQVGVEINNWDVRHQRFGSTEDWFTPKPKMNRKLKLWRKNPPTYFMWGDPLGDPSKMFLVRREKGAISWVQFLVRNVKIPVKRGWEQTDCFSLSITPPKAYDPYFATLKGYNVGPYTYRPGWKVPGTDFADTLKSRGYDYAIGLVNCRTGEYLPDDPAGSRKIIKACQERGIKVIPYTTLMDLNVYTDYYREHGEAWAIDPATDHG